MIVGYEGQHAAAFAAPQHQAAKAFKTEPTPSQQTSPFQTFQAAATAGAAAESVSALVDLTSPTAGPRSKEPATVDLTNEVSLSFVVQRSRGLKISVPYVRQL